MDKRMTRGLVIVLLLLLAAAPLTAEQQTTTKRGIPEAVRLPPSTVPLSIRKPWARLIAKIYEVNRLSSRFFSTVDNLAVNAQAFSTPNRCLSSVFLLFSVPFGG